jgi:4-coumarate--CoA ligase
MRDTKPKYIFVHPTLLPVLLSAFTILRLSKSDATHRIILISPSAQSQNQPEYYLTLPTLLAHSLSRTPSSFKEQDFSGKKAHETIFIYYSSGTTGLPKGVELTHHNITSVMNACRSWGSGFLPGSNLEGDGKDVFIAVLPFYHVYGNAMVITFPLMIGVPAVIVPGFEPNLFLGCISRYRVTVSSLPIFNHIILTFF